MNRQKPEDVLGVGPGAARPFTGAEYLESLKDGREVYTANGSRMSPRIRRSATPRAPLRDSMTRCTTRSIATC